MDSVLCSFLVAYEIMLGISFDGILDLMDMEAFCRLESVRVGPFPVKLKLCKSISGSRAATRLPLQRPGGVAPGKSKRCVSRVGTPFQVWSHGPITLDSCAQRTRGLYCFQNKPVLRLRWQVHVVEMTSCPLQSLVGTECWTGCLAPTGASPRSPRTLPASGVLIGIGVPSRQK